MLPAKGSLILVDDCFCGVFCLEFVVLVVFDVFVRFCLIVDDYDVVEAFLAELTTLLFPATFFASFSVDFFAFRFDPAKLARSSSNCLSSSFPLFV